jgi:transposase
MTKKTGRPAKMTPESKAILLKALGLGISEEDSAKLVGVSRATVRREALADKDFAQDKKGAVVAGKMRLLRRITAASREAWTAAAWLLERRFPQEFGRRTPDTLTAEEVAEMAADLVGLAMQFVPKDKHAAFRERVRERFAGRARKKR